MREEGLTQTAPPCVVLEDELIQCWRSKVSLGLSILTCVVPFRCGASTLLLFLPHDGSHPSNLPLSSPFFSSSLPSFLFPAFSFTAEGVHPVQRRGGGACVAASAGDRRGQRALAPPPPAAVLPVATQASELRPRLTLRRLASVKRLQTDC